MSILNDPDVKDAHNVPTLSHIRRPDESDIHLGLMGQQMGSLGKTVTM